MSLLDALRSKGAVVVDYTAEVKKTVQEIEKYNEQKKQKEEQSKENK